MIHNVIKENAYFDSVTLMLFSSKLNDVEGVEEAAVMMGTNHNVDLMLGSNVLEKEVAEKVTANDLLIGIRAKNQEAIDEALKVLDEQFENKDDGDSDKEIDVKTVEAAVKEKKDLNFAIVSTPGRFAKKEVRKCLENDINVLLFSDNVSLEDEIELKDLALEKDLLMMGPDAGTAIVNGVALGFANVVSRGNIGLVAASGTGLQEVSVLVDIFGGGISQALGTGGRDVKDSVGGKMMLRELDALNADPMTEVIGIVSKPPSEKVLKQILDKVETFDKPVVVCFLGGDKSMLGDASVHDAYTLENAAQALVNLAEKKPIKEVTPLTAKDIITPLSKNNHGKYIRGLYTGGTLAYESMLFLQESLDNVYANIAMSDEFKLEDPETSKAHSIVDMGEDYFTDGMAHPMIDPRLRSERIKKEALDEETAVILLDCVLGYGSHADPAGEIVKAIESVKPEMKNKDIAYVASVTGTEKDFQIRSAQIEKLESAGVTVLPTNAQAVQYAQLLLDTKGGQK
jgi:succinyl-CoA synthetase alpha subunit